MHKFSLRITDRELDKKWEDVRVKAIRQKISINQLIQNLIKEWLKKKGG